MYGYGYEVGLEYAILWLSALVSVVSWGVSFLCLRGDIVVDYPHLVPTPGKLNIPTVSWRPRETTATTENQATRNANSEPHGATDKEDSIPMSRYDPRPEGARPVVRVATRESRMSDDSQRIQSQAQRAIGEAAWERLLFPIAYSECSRSFWKLGR